MRRIMPNTGNCFFSDYQQKLLVNTSITNVYFWPLPRWWIGVWGGGGGHHNHTGRDLSNAWKFLRDLFHEMYNLCFFWMAVSNMTKYIFHKNAIGNWKCSFLQKVKANIEIPSPSQGSACTFQNILFILNCSPLDIHLFNGL